MTVLLALHAVLGLSGVAFGARLGRRGLWLGVLGPLVTVVWLIVALPGVLDGEVVSETVRWVPALGIDVDLRLDGFAALMVVLVSGIGVLVYAYAARYFPREGPDLGRLIGLLTLFSGSMLGLVLTDNLLVLYGFWELTSVTSFLLIGNTHRDGKARAAALQALLVTGVGALAMLAGFIVLGQAAGTYRLSRIVADPPEADTTVVGALVLILLGAFTKSAQYPFHSWLPGAMVAPTPVSAYLHSATMVKAGVYLVARLAPAFAPVGIWRPLVVTVGLVTMIGAGLRALRQTDLKLLLAMGTVSQLGFMTAVFGWGSPEAVAAGCVLLLAHGAFKAAAFMVVGILDHQHGSRDIRALPRPAAGWQTVTIVTLVSSASMAGVPLVLGFVSKEAALDAFVRAEGAGGTLALVGLVAGSMLTAAYSARFAAGALGRLARPDAARACAEGSHGPPVTAFVAPALVLTAFTVLVGVLPALADGVAGTAAVALDPLVEPVHLAVWHGFNLPLLLSLIALAGGVALFLGRGRVEPVLAAGHTAQASSAGAYAAALRGLNALADRVTGIVQPGSLPIYIGVITFTAAVIPGALLLTGPSWPGWPELVRTPGHIAAAAVIIGAALAAAVVRRRFTAALFLGVTGYAMAGLFVVQGAPDLALTQVSIETLTTVLFVLVLRRLPDRFEHRQPQWRRALRIAVAASVAGTVFFLALASDAEDPPTPASDTMVERALPDGEGRNVVNVILVDFRGWDTLGEITVLAAAAIGTVALARSGRRPTGSPSIQMRGSGGDPLSGSSDHRVPPAVRLSRLVTLDVSMRAVFIAVMVGSLYLLFAGHNQPGGGFAGGIVAGAAVALRYISGGIDEVRRMSRSQPWTVLGTGVLLAATVALVPLAVGGAVLETGSFSLHPPLLGTVKLTSTLAFDIGVYLAVIGLALMVFESFGDDPPPRPVGRRVEDSDTPAQAPPTPEKHR
ncbi:hydrogen gas-evolving membrane-bound hydrogenase subunit E [Iamia sp.]|uniref:hydrogen gas-evolving membrane-bound hydrogenase subunit E n=1 Tax=Iamia sp. TaxID=2722710 RepID=UPI002C1A9A61|nr:hydrogen gas-evolving membrane-bound hydrogenase subunit E [Iamia sp.]HXH57712.1 hydrogen gas-evolving membrane-bound hydrogenase subunit E [Iamia sp.]